MAKLAEKQDIVLRGLVSGKTRAECSQLANVSESTIYNWLNDETFRAKLKDAQARVFDESTAQLYGLASLAVESLKRGLTGNANAVEVRTAIAVFAQATRLREIELVDRIERLEQILQSK